MNFQCRTFFVGLFLIMLSACSDSHQQADPDFIPQNTLRSFSEKNSPVVFIDEAHNNFLTMSGRYKPLSQVLTSDGYTVKPGKNYFSLEYLNKADVLIIANALDKSRTNFNPPFTDAFTNKEVAAVKQWVLQGGSLFLVADHTPFPKVIENLANEFGFEFSNGHVGNAIFQTTNKTLGEHVITTGVNNSLNESVQKLNMPLSIQGITGYSSEANPIIQTSLIVQVKSFGGSAFKPPQNAISLLTLGAGAVSDVPDIPFQVNSNTPKVSVSGWSQGAVLEIGKGRIAVFAEGMMFSSQLDTKTDKKYGLGSKGAEQNERFLLNVMSWLAGVI